MCRLFGSNAGLAQVHASYWLLSAPDSICAQSRRNPDGTGIGWFDTDGSPHVEKQPIAAHSDQAFRRDAYQVSATTLVTHVRAATTGSDSVANCHPFLIDGLITAHNGGFGELAKVDAHLGAYRRNVRGDTDSERFAALIALETARHGGDVGTGLAVAAGWLARNVPLYSLNAIVISPGNLWALRYPDQRALHVGARVVAPATGEPQALQMRSRSAVHRLTSRTPTPVVIVASERIDESDDWRMLTPGELIHVDADLRITSTIAVDHAPACLRLPNVPDPNDDEF